MADDNVSGTEPEETGVDLNAPEIQSYVKKQLDTAVSGLKSKNSELLGKMKALEQRLTGYDGIDPDQIRVMMKRFSDDEEARLLKEGKLDDVVQRRASAETERYAKQIEAKDRALQEAQAAREEIERQAHDFQDRYKRSVINNRVAAEVSGLRSKALPLVHQMISGWFELDDNEQPQPTDRAPLTSKGEALKFSELRDYLLNENEFLFEQSQGGKLPPGKAGANGKRVITRAQFDTLGPTEKQNVLRSVREAKADLID